MAEAGDGPAKCTTYVVRRQWISINLMTVSAATAAFGRTPKADLTRAEELYQRTEYERTIEALLALDTRDAADNALLGKAYFMEGRYREAVANLERAVREDGLNSGYYDWLGKAYGRTAETSNFLSALGYAKKTVRAFERAVELDPSNLEALSDVLEYYLEAPGMVGGGLDKAERVAMRLAGLNEAEYHWARARLAEQRKDYPAAEREFRAALLASPNDVGRTLDLASFLSSRGRYGESEALFRAAEERHPNAPKVLYARAAAYVRSKRRLDDAETLLERYLTLQTTPDDPTRQEVAALLKSARDSHAKSRLAE